MECTLRWTIWIAALAMLASAAYASVPVTVVEVPTDSVTVGFTAAEGGPAFGLKAEMNYRHGQTRVEVHFSGKHQPAVLYGGDVTCYVLWAIEPDGTADNLGELRDTGDNEARHFRTPTKRFALLVTAESYGLVRRPSELVVFTNDPPKSKKVNWDSMIFDDFAWAPIHDHSTITDLEFKRTEPMNLLEARKAFELAVRNEAEFYAPDLFLQAAAELDTAEELHSKKHRGDKFDSATRGAIDASAQAIHIATSAQAAELLADVIEERQARMRELEVRSEADELVIAVLLERKADLEDEVGLLSAELQDALAVVAETRLTAAGVVLTLPEILFETGKATLKEEAELALAKLAGIMLVFPNVEAAIGGYTDSSGNPELNLDLSLRRAETVEAVLDDQGVDPGRLEAVGFGAENPVADNSTSRGRSQNRRVEIVVVAGAGG